MALSDLEVALSPSTPSHIREALFSVRRHDAAEKDRKLAKELEGHLKDAIASSKDTNVLAITAPFTELPAEVFRLAGLRGLQISGTSLTVLPDAFGEHHKQLQWLNLSNNKLQLLPPSVTILKDCVSSFEANNNQLTEIPTAVGTLQKLKTLSLLNNQLTSVSASVCQLKSLTTLALDGNNLTMLHDDFGRLVNLTTLTISHNKFTKLPQVLATLPQLQRVMANKNLLTEFPAFLSACPALQHLDLASNDIKEVPSSVGSFNALRTLNLAYNSVRVLPGEIGIMPSLERIDLDGNPLHRPPIRYFVEEGSEGILRWARFQQRVRRLYQLRSTVWMMYQVLDSGLENGTLDDTMVVYGVNLTLDGVSNKYYLIAWDKLEAVWPALREYFVSSKIPVVGEDVDAIYNFGDTPIALLNDDRASILKTDIIHVSRMKEIVGRKLRRMHGARALERDNVMAQSFKPGTFWSRSLSELQALLLEYVDPCGPVMLDNITGPAEAAAGALSKKHGLFALRDRIDTHKTRRTKLQLQWLQDAIESARNVARKQAERSLRSFGIREKLASELMASVIAEEAVLRRTEFEGAVVGSIRHRLNHIQERYALQREKIASLACETVQTALEKDRKMMAEHKVLADKETAIITGQQVAPHLLVEIQQRLYAVEEKRKALRRSLMAPQLLTQLEEIAVAEKDELMSCMEQVDSALKRYKPLGKWGRAWYSFVLGSKHKNLVATKLAEAEDAFIKEKEDKAENVARETYTKVEDLMQRLDVSAMRFAFRAFAQYVKAQKIIKIKMTVDNFNVVDAALH